MHHITHVVPNNENLYAKFQDDKETFEFSKVLFFVVTEDCSSSGPTSFIEPIVYFQSGEIDSAYEFSNFVGIVPESCVDKSKVF